LIKGEFSEFIAKEMLLNSFIIATASFLFSLSLKTFPKLSLFNNLQPNANLWYMNCD